MQGLQQHVGQSYRRAAEVARSENRRQRQTPNALLHGATDCD